MLQTVSEIHMAQSLSLPDFDPIVHALLILAFLVHAIFMNLVVGGTVVMVITDVIGMVTARTCYQQLASVMSRWLPGFLGLAVVLGIFPLVFVQMMYKPIFMPALNLLGGMWVMALSAGLVGFGALYGYKHWRDSLSHQPAWYLGIGLLSIFMFLAVAWVFVVTSVLMLNPDQWSSVQNTGQWSVLSLPTLLPRFVHLVLAAVAGMGIFLVCYGLLMGSSHQGLTEDEPKERYGTWIIQYGVAWTLGGTLPQIVIGPWLLLTLPDVVRQDLVGGQHFGSIAFFAGLTTALLSLVLLNASLMVPNVKGFAIGGILSLGVTIGFMVIVRHAVRVSWLSQHEMVGLVAQDRWEVLGVVFGILLLGLGLAIVMARAQKRMSIYR